MCVNKVDYLLLIKEACNALQYYDLNFMFITMSSFRKRRRRRRRASSGGEEEEEGGRDSQDTPWIQGEQQSTYLRLGRRKRMKAQGMPCFLA